MIYLLLMSPLIYLLGAWITDEIEETRKERQQCQICPRPGTSGDGVTRHSRYSPGIWSKRSFSGLWGAIRIRGVE